MKSKEMLVVMLGDNKAKIIGSSLTCAACTYNKLGNNTFSSFHFGGFYLFPPQSIINTNLLKEQWISTAWKNTILKLVLSL
jgi:hypothetical protein